MNQLSIVEQVMLKGNLSALNPQQKIEYYAKTCESLGLNPLTKPFEYIVLNGKEVLYATKGCTEQLRNIHGVSIKIVDKQKIEDIFVVTAEATNRYGRTDSATGVVNITGLKGDALANAMMKAETKAKRRVTLSLCGLNMLDESEVETVPTAKKVNSVNFQSQPITPVTVTSTVHTSFEPEPSLPTVSSEGIPPMDLAPFDNSFEGGFGVQYNPEYRIPFGTDKGKTLDDLGVGKVKSRIKYFEGQVSEGKTLTQNVLDFVDMAYAYVKQNEV